MSIVYHPTEEFLGLRPPGWYWIDSKDVPHGPFNTYGDAEVDTEELPKELCLHNTTRNSP